MKRMIISISVLLLLAGAFFLPSFTANLKDRQMIGQYTVTDGAGISFEATSDLGTMERLKLVTEAESIRLENGKELDHETAYTQVLTELAQLNVGGFIGLDLDSCYMLDASVSFFIDSADSTKSLIVWSINLEDAMGRIVHAALDDETGKLLWFHCYSERVMEKPEPDGEEEISLLAVSPDELAEIIAGYYGLDAAVIDMEEYTPDYAEFTIQLSDGDSWVNIRGGISGYDLWLN